MGEEQHPKTEQGDEEKKQPESGDKDNNDIINPTLDRTASCFSVATSPTPSPKSPSDIFVHTPRWSLMSGSPHSAGITTQLSFPENPSPEASPLQSPSPPSTDFPPGYDPKRIPSSIFSRKSGAGADWSGGSNESLFSIHVGNGSFVNGGEVSERKSVSSLSPLAADCDAKDLKMSDASLVKGVAEAAKASSGNATPSSQHLSPSPGNPNAPPVASLQSPRFSNGSVNSCQSFAFPVLVKDVSRKPGAQSQPVPQPESVSQPETPPPQPEPQPEKEAAQPETPKETSKAAEPSCFTCFSCWPRCC